MSPSLWSRLHQRGCVESYDGQIYTQIVRHFLFATDRLHANGHGPRVEDVEVEVTFAPGGKGNCSGFEHKTITET
ncbi:hypothetical protein TcWFU_007902 [Taenia crassiceps]|uniref:Uncharacterized protein n=1 Tax=Taenia crassiceps TaxID=6207 RepID=A0ABR4Q1Z6_9CEST